MKSIIQKMIVSITILFLIGCSIDSLKCYEVAKEAAETDYVTRVHGDDNAEYYVIIDKNGYVREIKYYGLLRSDTPKAEWDTILFKIENFDKSKIKIIHNALSNE